MSGILPPDDSTSPPAPAPRPEPRSAVPETRRPLHLAGLILACAWLAVPALQYFGTFQRTGLQIEGTAPSPQFATLDLTVLYLILLAATIVLTLLRRLLREGDGTSPDLRPDMPHVPPEALS